MVDRADPRFDATYYDRYYESPKTRVQGARDVARLIEGITAMISLAGGELKNALDVGAGPGLWRDWFQRYQPRVRYRSTDVSAYACRRYGHERRDITRWRARERFDLIVCQGVLPYLAAFDAERAIDNIAQMSRGFLYLEAITKSDYESVCECDLTDGKIHLRARRWYAKRLERQFVMLGLGLWMRRTISHSLYDLEHGL